MPKSMSVKCFIIFFAIYITIAEPLTQFMDCGSLLEIHNVKIEGCQSSPCVFSPGDNVTVEVNLIQGPLEYFSENLELDIFDWRKFYSINSILFNFLTHLVVPEATELVISELYSEAYISMYGHKWPLTITPVNPCTQWTCPLDEMSNLTYVAEIVLSTTLIKRPGQVMMQSSYESSGSNVIAICIQFSISLV